jgi:hypothetical protein
MENKSMLLPLSRLGPRFYKTNITTIYSQKGGTNLQAKIKENPPNGTNSTPTKSKEPLHHNLVCISPAMKKQ